MNLYGKLFLSGNWRIGLRKGNQEWPIDYNKSFQTLIGEKGYWYADSLLFENDNKHYLFCEAFNKKEQKGEIAVSVLEDGNWSIPKVVISNNYHMSYPCVFKYGNDIFMIPESQENNTLELYKAISFPFDWEKVNNLLVGEKYADATVFDEDGQLYIIAYKSKKRCAIIFKLNIADCSVDPVTEIPYTDNIGRPAGTLIKVGDIFYRPSQDCRWTYGEKVLWNRFVTYKGGFKEILDGELDNKSVIIDGKRGVDKIHTFSRAGSYEAIDYYVYTFDLLKRLKIMWMHHKRDNRIRKRKGASL